MAKKRINRDKTETGVTFTVIETGETLTCDVSALPKEIIPNLLVHAINAKVGDSAADPTQNALEAMTNTWNQLVEGIWNAKGSGGSGPKVTQLAEALSRVTGQDMDTVTAKLADMTDEQKKGLRKHAQVKAALSEISKERAAEKAKRDKAQAKEAKALDF